MEELQKEVELDCDPERAWQALTEESELESWLGGEVEADLRPGGEITVRDEDGTERSGFFESVEPEKELSFWWGEEDSDETTRVAIGVRPNHDGEGCVVTVVESSPMVDLERELQEITAEANFSSGEGPSSGLDSAGPTARAFALA